MFYIVYMLDLLFEEKKCIELIILFVLKADFTATLVICYLRLAFMDQHRRGFVIPYSVSFPVKNKYINKRRKNRTSAHSSLIGAPNVLQFYGHKS